MKEMPLMTSGKSGQYIIRNIRKSEIGLLKDFLYEAVFVPEGVEHPPRDIVERPELRVYTDDFGTRKGDNCLVAELGGRVVGSVWTRIMDDYGHVDDETPSCAVSLYKEYRGQGIGSQLMMKMLDLLRQQGYKKVSLSVQKANYAVKMYEKSGFKTVDEMRKNILWRLSWLRENRLYHIGGNRHEKIRNPWWNGAGIDIIVL